MKTILMLTLIALGPGARALDLGCHRAKDLILADHGTFNDRVGLNTHVVAPLNPEVEAELRDFLDGDRKGTICLEGSRLQYDEYFVWKARRP